jgi:hypothetical protein
LPTPGYSVQLNRVYFNIFQNKKLVQLKSNTPRRIEFLSYTSSDFDYADVYFETKLSLENDFFRKYLPLEKDLKSKAFGPDYTLGNKLMMERMASMARRFSEWTIAEHIIDLELEEGDIVIKDGSLQTAHPNEDQYIKKVLKKAEKKGVIFTGLSKTSRYTTTTRIPLISAIDRFSKEMKIPYREWCYFPVPISRELEKRALIMIIKLNRHADTPFRFEIFRDQAERMSKTEILEVVSTIADYSRDITLPGYPYGLIDAHLWARVRDEEISTYQAMLYSEISRLGMWKEVNSHINTINTHDKLDEM